MDAKLVRFILEQAEPLPVDKRVELYTTLLASLTDRDQKRELLSLIEQLRKVQEQSSQLLFSFPK